MDRKTVGYKISGPRGEPTSMRTEDKFIDNASLMTNNTGDNDVVNQLQKNSQLHERLLYCTGGRLAMHKCFWTLLRYHWAEGKATVENYDETL